jgi:PAS domain S-box-containing protein
MPASELKNPWRLQALHATGLLDTEPEPAFDRVTRMAIAAAHATMGFLSLVTEDRQFMKSQSGLPAGAAQAANHEPPYSLCMQVVAKGEPCEVADVQAPGSEHLRNMWVFRDAGARAYAAVPVRDHHHKVLGTLTVLDHNVHVWTVAELDGLTAAAAYASVEILTRHLTTEVERCTLATAAVFESITDAFFTVNLDWRFTYVNQRAAASIGRRAEELVGQSLWECCADLVGSRFESEYRRAIQENVPVTFEEFHVQQRRWYSVRAYPGVEGLAVFYLDMTEQRRNEAEMRESDRHRREAMARMAGAIAHDVNNLLTVVQGVTELLHLGLLDGDPLREDVGHIQAAVARTAALAQKLLAVSKKQVLKPEVVDLAQMVEDRAATLGLTTGALIHLEIETSGETGTVFVDAGRMEQVLASLVENACDAMPDGGQVTVRTERRVLTEPDDRMPGAPLTPGPYVVLSVTDTGHGMDLETTQRIFEPFFSTRGRGPSAGLGLATVLGIVEQSLGAIDVHSDPGSGTRFDVYLPEADAAVHPDNPLPLAVQGDGASGSELILVAEDEQVVRRLASDSLQRLGYRVLAAEDGRQALAMFMEHQGEVDLVLTDVVMPHLGGVQLANRIAEIRPELPIVFVSGYTEESIGARLSQGHASFLAKPYTFTALALKIRRLLDASRASGPDANPPGP